MAHNLFIKTIVSSEILTNAIRDTIYPVDFSIYSTCPRAVEMDPPEIPVNYPIHYDSLAVRHVGIIVNRVAFSFHAKQTNKKHCSKINCLDDKFDRHTTFLSATYCSTYSLCRCISLCIAFTDL